MVLDSSFIFTLGGTDFSPQLSTIKVTEETSYRSTITTLDDTEHPYIKVLRDVVDVTFLPMTEAQSTALYTALKSNAIALQFTDPFTGATKTENVYVTTDLESTFCLMSIDGKRRYKGGTVTLRALAAN